METAWKTFGYEDLVRELTPQAPSPCLVVRIKGSLAHSFEPRGLAWRVLHQGEGAVALGLPDVLREVAPGRFVYDAVRAGEQLVALYKALEQAAGPEEEYDLHVALWLPSTARLVECAPGPWSVLAPEILWSATEGQHLSRRELHGLDEFMRGPTPRRHANIEQWLQGFARARGVLLQIEENAPVWEY